MHFICLSRILKSSKKQRITLIETNEKWMIFLIQ